MSFLSVLGAIANPLSSLIGAGSSAINIGQQKQLMQQNNEFQAAENQKNREWQSQEWTRQFDLTNAYNDPSAAVQRLQNAGLNPAQVMSGAGSSNAVSHALPSAPSGGVSATPSPDYSGVLTSGFQSMQQIANSIKMLTEAKKTAKETPYIGALLDSQIKENLARFENEQAKTDYQKLQTQFEQIFGHEKRSKELAKLMSDTLLADQEARLKGAQIELIDVEKLEKNMNALVAYAEKNKKEVEAARIKALIEPEISLLKAQANQASAAAKYSASLAKTEDSLRSLRHGLLQNELKFNSDTLYDRIDSLRESLDRSILTNDEIRLSLERMKFANGLKEFDYWYGQFLRTISTLTSGVPGRVAPGEFSTIHDAVEPAPGRVPIKGF